MYNFCIKIDESISSGFEQQLLACSRFQINNMELEDCFEGINLADLGGMELEKYRRLLVEHNKKIVLLDSSINVNDTEKYALLFRKAYLLGVENIRVDYTDTLQKDPEDKTNVTDKSCFENEHIMKLAELLRIGRSFGIGIVFENSRISPAGSEKELSALFSVLSSESRKKIKWLDAPRLLDKQLAEYNPGMVFNPLEYAAMKKHPFFHVFYNTRLKPAIRFLRVNDGLFEDGRPMLPGQGNAELKELVSALLARSFKGYFSFTPYMKEMSLESYETVIKRFKNILMAL